MSFSHSSHPSHTPLTPHTNPPLLFFLPSFQAAKNTVYIGLAMSMLVFAVMNIAQAMPYLDKPFNVSKVGG